MKLIKMLGLAVVSVIMAMAFAGASSASAKTVEFCKKAENNCPTGERYELPQKFSAKLKEGTTAELVGAAPVKCTESTTSGEIKSAEPEHQAQGVINTLAFKNCTLFGSPCTVHTEDAEFNQLPYKLHVWQDERTGHLGDGHMSVGPKEPGALQPGAKIVCPNLLVTCEFKAKEPQDSPSTLEPDISRAFEEEHVWANMQIIGGNPQAFVKTENQEEKRTQLKSLINPKVCGEEAEWIAEYEITEPAPLFIVEQLP